MKQILRLGLVLFLAMACCSCASWSWLDFSEINEPVFVPASQISEQDLIKKGVPYKKYDEGNIHGYYLPKSQIQKVSNYAVLAVEYTAAVPVLFVVAILEKCPSPDAYHPYWQSNDSKEMAVFAK